MKPILVILFFISGSFSCQKNSQSMTVPGVPATKYYYLALGDSYTIGERVSSPENFPSQVCAMMKNDTVDFQRPAIIARTGWTTDELEAGIIEANNADPLRSSYDFVSLLIGVNNQYRGRSVDSYKREFEELLKKAIRFAANKADHVVVLSIPDWGVTPFATGRDRAQIAAEIDAYNAANKQIAFQYTVHYIDITAWTRDDANDTSFLATDGLHPSGKEYKRWAETVSSFFKQKIK